MEDSRQPLDAACTAHNKNKEPVAAAVLVAGYTGNGYQRAAVTRTFLPWQFLHDRLPGIHQRSSGGR